MSLVVAIEKSQIGTTLTGLAGRNFVYQLLRGVSIVYIGHTRSLYSRMVAHKYSVDFDKVIIHEFDCVTQCRECERNLIKLIRPGLNVRSCRDKSSRISYVG